GEGISVKEALTDGLFTVGLSGVFEFVPKGARKVFTKKGREEVGDWLTKGKKQIGNFVEESVDRAKKVMKKTKEEGALFYDVWKKSGDNSVYAASLFGAGQKQIDRLVRTGKNYKIVKEYGTLKSPTEIDYIGGGDLDVPVSKSTKGTGNAKYQVGAYKDIKGVKGLDAHHAGQKAAMKKLVEGYDSMTAPAINVPRIGHTKRHPVRGIVSRSTKGITNARQLLTRDIMELRRVYPDIPNSKLQELIEMNKKLYKEMRK
ncbi:hypothetical protein, partial [Dethiothermospora halolimnae]|uniref:hypothetical protein n=1 Tax=Dethiothermospora halolimnae TaxID=3114390 RepID=UPI003CCBA80C